MRLSTTRMFPLLLMLALAGLTFWLERTVREEQGPHPSQRRHDPDYVVDNLSYARFNLQGAVESTLAAAKMLHYPDDDSTDLVAPRVVQTKPNEPRVTLTADRGTLSQDGEEVFLYGNVLLVREAGPGHSETRIRTDFLHLVQARSVVRTDRDVVVTENNRELSGRGMEYHNNTKELFLRERVRGRFEPKAR
ncbi:MAG: LPS export ABC transporter periplasmic protein LptC [Candidatus Parcubacteria bacterium]|nr:LPS export ABC transporter periplasmic protein LptC [Burkholderiales bacterium]